MTCSRLARYLFGALVGTASLAAPLAISAQQAAIAAPQVSDLAVQAARLALAGKFEDAGSAAQQSRDQAAIKLVELIYLRDHPNEAGYGRIMEFLNAAPKWPLTDALMKRAERSLYANHEPTEMILQHFAKRQPLTAEGALALARARFATGDAAGGAAMVRQAWYNPDVDATLEKSIAEEFKSVLTAGDIRTRMWKSIFAQQGNAAVRLAGRLGGDERAAALTAQALLRNQPGASKLYSGLSAAMRGQMAVKYALARYYRKHEAWDSARAVLLSVPGNAAAMGDPQAWWEERRIAIRHSVGPNHRDAYKAAYQMAAANGLTGNDAIEGEFLAGWVALRSLKDPVRALGHFQKLDSVADSRTEKARAKYWLGRAYAALKRPADAKSAFREAAQYSTIYYGQLAREQLGMGAVPEEISSGTPSPGAMAKINDDDAVRAFEMVAKAGSKKDLYMFLWSFAQRFNTADEMNAAASVAWDVGGPTMAVRLAKAAGARDIDIDAWSYPIRALPDWKQIGKPVEKALVFGLSRQESEFNPDAGSSVGAQGLMQIMPATARLIARQYGLSYHNGILTGDPSYNVKLGAAHLGDLIDSFGGSYVLTLVAYNAGPRRSSQWVAEYGDLRDGSNDPVDWVESIPFNETRQYVQKVLQNVHVYRSRLAPSTVRPMSADLARGASSNAVVNQVADQINTATTGKAHCKSTDITALISTCK